jgi:PAS domain S-box-containing protein
VRDAAGADLRNRREIWRGEVLVQERFRVSVLVLIMTAVAVTILGVAIGILYDAAFEEKRRDLIQTAQSQARLMEAVARFDRRFNQHGNIETAAAATISQIKDAHDHYKGFGETGEFVLARRQQDNIVFLLRDRLNKTDNQKTIPFNSPLVAPMRRALEGHSGSMSGLDYRGVSVLAAYEPVAILNLGIVAKVDIAEVREPFVSAGAIVAVISILIVGAGTALFFRVSNPILRRIQENEKQYRVLVDGQADLICRNLPDGTLTSVNESYCRWFDKTADELVGTSFSQFIPQEHRQSALDHLQTFTPENSTQTHEHKVQRADGDIRWVQWTNTATFDENDQVKEFVAVGRDITEHKRADNARYENAAMLQGIFDNTPICLNLKDTSGRYILLNKPYADWLGHSAEEIIGKQAGEFLENAARVDTMSDVEKTVLKTGEINQRELKVQGRDGNMYDRQVIKFPVKSADGHITAIGTVAIDITESKKTEEALLQSMKVAEAAKRSMSEFLAHMSHELRTPLNSIIGFSEFLQTEMFGPLGHDHYREYVAAIHVSGRHLHNVIGDILDISKIEAGELTLNVKEFHIYSMLLECFQMIQERTERGGLTLSINAEKNSQLFHGDELRLKQIVLNLLSNAIKFTPTGGKVSIHANLNNDGEMVLSVEDTGVGIAAEDMPRILEPFGQIREDPEHAHEGTGLGLSLSKSLVELHGGTLSIDSEVGKGTLISVRIPSAETPAS